MAQLQRTLSSGMTFVIKWLFPLVWSAGWGFGTIALLLHPETAVFNGVPVGAPPGTGLLMLAAWLIATPFLVAIGWGLKRVRLSGSDLLVSNYLREARIPLRDVEAVRRRIFPHAGGIAIDFVTPTVFGRSISFIAGHRTRFGGVDALVDELNSLVAHASRLTKFAADAANS